MYIRKYGIMNKNESILRLRLSTVDCNSSTKYYQLTAEIPEIDKSKIDNQVKVTGIIENYTITKTGTMIITLNDGSNVIKVVIFPSTSLNTTLYNGMNITVTAKVVEYNGEMELIIEKSKNLEINS